MSSLVEQHIKNLQESVEQIAQETFANAKHRKIRSMTPLLNLLQDIEGKPLRVEEMRMLRSTVVDYIQKNDLQAEKDFMRIVTKRFSMAYLPGISYSGLRDYILALDQAGFGHVLQQYITNWRDIVEQRNPPSPKHNMQNTHNHSRLHLPPLETSTGPDRSIASQFKNMRYIMCSFRRSQSALWTSYRFFLDGVHELDVNGELTKTTFLEQPIMLLGAKRFKSGISAQCYVWNVEDSKTWKEKSAVARITRNANIYLGIPCQPSAYPSTAQDATDPEVSNNNDSEPGSSVPTSNSITSMPSEQPDKSKSTDTVNSDLSTAIKLIGKDLFDGGPVSIAVQTKGQEKLIQLTIALHKRNGSSTTTNPVSTSSNEEILNDLEQLARNPIGFSTTASSTTANQSLPYMVLRSKAPRKLSDSDANNNNNNNNTNNNSNNGNHNSTVDKGSGTLSSSTIASTSNTAQSQFGLSFGKHSRIRVASRKNLVADTWIDLQNNNKRIALTNDWTTVNSDAIPLLQVGKIDEDRFAVDFHSISPFQAFVVAMAIFDH